MGQTDLKDDLELLRSAAVAAGIIASGFFRNNVKTWTKENASPVTEADETVNNFLEQTLLGARPGYGWLSEESPDNAERLHAQRVFVVDPIDGTRAFIKGEDCWTICIAIVENGVPVAGVVYAPARDELYEARKGHGAFRNKTRLPFAAEARDLPLIPAPAAVHRELDKAGYAHVKGPAYPSLAYRLVQVATGRIDGALARRGAQDWDIAAAAAILWEAGKTFEDVCETKLVFNKAETRHGALAALGDKSVQALVRDVLRQVYGCPAEAAHN
jgi:myo-inositol-1(or 4)-monophosphatase